jgi:hypothetical protein
MERPKFVWLIRYLEGTCEELVVVSSLQISPPTGIRFPDIPARSQPLHWNASSVQNLCDWYVTWKGLARNWSWSHPDKSRLPPGFDSRTVLPVASRYTGTHGASKICVIDTLLRRDLRGIGRGLIVTLSCYLEELKVARSLIPDTRVAAEIWFGHTESESL